MMKKITLLLALLVTSFGFSQTIDLLTNGDFENGTAPWTGNNFTVEAGEAFISTTNAAGDPWGTQLVHGGLAFVNAQEYTLTFWARAAADRNITVAIQNVNIWDDQFRQDFALTTTMTEFTATFNATSTNTNVQIGFLMAGFGSTDAIYYDDISLVTAAADPTEDATLSDLTVDGTTVSGFSDGTLSYDIELTAGTTVVPTVVGTPTQSSPATAVTTAAGSLPGASTVLVTAQDGSTTETYTVNFTVAPSITPPTVAAPTPPVRNAADVVSIYSDAYTAISPINYDEAWCGAGAVTATTAGGDNVFAYNDKNCQGIGFTSDLQDLTGLTNLHVDLFISVGTDLVGKVFNVKVVYNAGGETSFNIDINGLSPAPVPGTWYSYDAPVTISGSNIQQVGITSNLNNVVWYDNLYFWKEAVDPLTDITLSDLTVDGTTVTGFEADKLTYDIILPKGTTVVPTVVGTPTQSSPATAVTTNASSLPGSSTVLVSAQDGSTTETYTLNFTVDTNTDCEGLSSEAQQGAFDNGGYSYKFETLGNGDVQMTFELLEAGAVGVVAYAWKESPFGETGMTVTGNSASIDLSGYASGEAISYAVKFAWAAGGFGVTKYFTYTVGDDCGTLGINDFQIEGLRAYPNPTNTAWTISTKDQVINSIDVYNVLGKRVLSLQPNALSAKVDASSLAPGMYFSTITTELGTSSRKLMKK